MHRITIVTHRNGSADLIPPSPLPALQTASDDSSRETGSPASSPDNSGSNQKPTKRSKWRQRGMRHVPPPYPDPIQLDLSLLKRRDLPIRLVVDEPVPVESNWDDPYTQTTTTTAGHNYNNRHSQARESKQYDDDDSPRRETEEKKEDVIGINNEGNFADFDAFNESCSKELTWVPFDPVWKSGSATTATEKEVHSVNPGSTSETGTDDSLHVFEDSEAMEGPHHSTPTVTSGNQTASASVMTNDSGPIVRIEYKGEMVSISEQTAARLQDLSWV